MGRASSERGTPEWREFEKLIARIEEAAGPLGIKVKSPDRIPSKVTGRLREVDASIRARIGTSEVLITIECRKRKPTQDVTWIEQLVAKKQSIGASRTIAVSASGFSQEATATAMANGIELRTLSTLSVADIHKLMRLNFVMFWKRHCAISGARVRFFRGLDGSWEMPGEAEFDYEIPPETDPSAPLFTGITTGRRRSLNDLWHELQAATDPFEEIGESTELCHRAFCYVFPGDFTLDTPGGTHLLGDVTVSVALWKTFDIVSIDEARKVEYASPEGEVVQRVEFEWHPEPTKPCRLSLQIPKDATDVKDLKVIADWPGATTINGEP
jgi:hypothetical protein